MRLAATVLAAALVLAITIAAAPAASAGGADCGGLLGAVGCFAGGFLQGACHAGGYGEYVCLLERP